MVKRILILGIVMSLIQTLLYLIIPEVLQFTETHFVAENNRQITDEAIP
ncbi:MAG: hypothetical protein PSX42_08905 [bacterium]|nr:hypothetical protein [bacterium]